MEKKKKKAKKVKIAKDRPGFVYTISQYSHDEAGGIAHEKALKTISAYLADAYAGGYGKRGFRIEIY